MAHLLLVRPADDSTAGHIATVGHAIQLLTNAFTFTDLYGTQADRRNVDTELSNADSMFYFGHGTPSALVAYGAALVDQHNVSTLKGGLIVAVACDAAITLGPLAVQNPTVDAFLGFDDELGFPLLAPTPVAMAIINGLRGLLTQGDAIGSTADELRRQFARAKVDYRTNGPQYGLSTSDTRTAWLFAKSNQHSVCLCGDTTATL